METHKPPFKFIGPGKVFRCEATDASHEAAFHQLEGMMVGKDISVANLIYFMKTLLSEIFQKETNVRLRPGFFPFVEPGFELDIECLICGGKGCSVCKQSGWVETSALRDGPSQCSAPRRRRSGRVQRFRFRSGTGSSCHDALRHRRHTASAQREPGLRFPVQDLLGRGRESNVYINRLD